MIGASVIVLGAGIYLLFFRTQEGDEENYGLNIKRLGENTARTTDISNIISGTGSRKEGFQKRTKSYDQAPMPKVSSEVTPFSVDVTNPQNHRTLGFQPRVELKSKYQDFSLANFIRGDVPITTYPDIPLISRTQQDYSDVRVGIFNERGANRRYRDARPMVSTYGQASGHGGQAGATIVQ